MTDVRNLWCRDDPTVAFVGHVRPAFGAIPPLAELQAMLWTMNLLGRVPNELRPEDEWHYRLLHPADSRVRYGVDEDTCTGDHSCIRLSGCPTLTVKDNPDPLRSDPVATVIDGCVGCGLCGENAHAAVLCPSFYRAEVVHNPNAWERFVLGLRRVFA